ncbi:hypothetical protein M9H77_30892 [Catharanthus roseus]|uniref:Uncharacterized protein n=1 Tax=Catharanthus roseus TaxID=4058 RepID=A0ACC0A0D2_CATRO|nr:hypothetical protein M9H77_30892 [Catharanthus roseus]
MRALRQFTWSKRQPSFDLNIPTVEQAVYERRNQKQTLANLLDPFSKKEAEKYPDIEKLPLPTDVVEQLIKRIACQNAEDKTKGRKSIRSEIRATIQEYSQNDSENSLSFSDRRRIIGTPTPSRANSPFVLPKNDNLAESEFAAPTITKLVPILFSTSGASVAYNVNPVADQFQRAFQTSTFCNRLYTSFNKRWFFDQVLNDFLVKSFMRFGYEVLFEALDKGAIEILGPYGISYKFQRLAEQISQLQSGFVIIDRLSFG